MQLEWSIHWSVTIRPVILLLFRAPLLAHGRRVEIANLGLGDLTGQEASCERVV